MTTSHPARTPAIDESGAVVYIGDALRVLAQMPSGSVDAVVCDPPYAIRANAEMRASIAAASASCTCRRNDAAAPTHDDCAARTSVDPDVFAEAPMLGQQSSNWHEKATHSRGYADNDNAVFAAWVQTWATQCLRVLKPGGHLVAFGGTRTWHRLATAVEDAGFEIRDSLAWLYSSGCPKSLNVGRAVKEMSSRRPLAVSDDAGLDTVPPEQCSANDRWEGWYTGVKPAHEPIVLARKPIVDTVAATVLAHGTGALNIAGTSRDSGLWPTNVFLDDRQASLLTPADKELATRYFFVSKPSKSERVTANGVTHPTVKPLELMRELIRLVAAPDAVVLDPFAGSGTTIEAAIAEGRRSIGIEREAAYLDLIRERVRRQTVAAAQRSVSPGSPRHSEGAEEAWTLFGDAATG